MRKIFIKMVDKMVSSTLKTNVNSTTSNLLVNFLTFAWCITKFPHSFLIIIIILTYFTHNLNLNQQLLRVFIIFTINIKAKITYLKF